MTLNDRLALSYYEEIAKINEEHGVSLVRHRSTGKIYVKKIMEIFNLEVFFSLKNSPIKNTPYIQELIEDDHCLIVIEEYISGQTLQEQVDAGQSFNEASIINIMLQLCDIVTALHTHNPPIIHRDIKPSNIIVMPDGTVKLLDMNAAKYSSIPKERDTQLLGTEGYAAPEQYGFGSSAIPTDIYSMGMVMNLLLTGKISRECTSASLLKKIIEKCLELSPENRYKSAMELHNALARYKSKGKVDSENKKAYPFLPPGFRSLNPFHMLVAICGYSFFLILLIETETTDNQGIPLPGPEAFSAKLYTLILVLSVLFFSADYMNVQKFFPLCRHSNPLIRFLGLILWNVVLILSVLLTFHFLDTYIL